MTRARRIATAWASGLIVVSVLATLGGLKLRAIAQNLPDISGLADTRFHPYTTIVSSDGVLLATFETHYRRPVPLDQVSPTLVAATIATEDSRFFGHSGIDARGTLRALLANLMSGKLAGQGGSTITQQLARNLYLSSAKTAERKVEEALLAVRMEKRYSKREILEAYLNTVYYGSGCFGVEAASRAYFHKPARSLDLGEAALLAGLPQRPAAYSPIQHLPEALRRREVVLKRMIDTGSITEAEAHCAEAKPIRLFQPRLQSKADWKAPYFVERVVKELGDRHGVESLYSGLRIVTTLNWPIQKAAERSLAQGLSRGLGPTTGALVALEPRSGAIRALVGGPDFARDQFDAATSGIRQPGSAFKPIVYAAALDSNVCSLANTLDDHKLEYRDGPRDWVVHNYSGSYRGPVTVLDAVRQSINTVAVQVAEQTGPGTVQAYGQRLGISTPMVPDLPLALGASGVHPIDLCSAYSVFANRGARFDPYAVEQVTDAQGRALYRDDPAVRLHGSLLNSSTIDQMNVALREVVTHGTGQAASGVPDAHGKTGTTSSHRDAWFVGYTGSLATAIWMAHPKRVTATDGHERLRYLPMPGATGGSLCAPVWARFMKTAASVEESTDKRLGRVTPVLAQPETSALMAELTQSIDHTGLEEARAADQVLPAGPTFAVDAWGSLYVPPVQAAGDPMGKDNGEASDAEQSEEAAIAATDREVLEAEYPVQGTVSVSYTGR